MMGTAIEWTDETWNPLAGCSVLSPGCTNCYAMREAGGRLRSSAKFSGLTEPSKAGPVWTGEVRLWEPALDQPLRWSKPRMIFVNSMSDLFQSVPDQWIDRIFAVMALARRHTFQVLTKRAERMRDYMLGFTKRGMIPARIIDAADTFLPRHDIRSISWNFPGWPLQNVWLGVSAEDRARLSRIDALRATPAAVRFLSLEPLLEDLGPLDLRGIDWVIVGGESGPGARPMHPDWARSIRDQCLAAGVPFFFKQWGEWAPAPEHMYYAEAAALACRHHHEFEPWSSGHTLIRVGKRQAGRLLDGVIWDEYPRAGCRRAFCDLKR